MDAPETHMFDAQAFDNNFFAAYEEQLAAISIEEQASNALAEILTIQKEDGTLKSYEEIRDETVTFFANDWVRNDEAMMNRMANEFAQACMSHNHGADLAQDNLLGPMFKKGSHSIIEDKHDHKSESHNHDAKDDKIDPITGKRSKKKKEHLGWLSLFFK